MSELYASERTLRFHEAHDARQRVALRIVPQAEAIRRNATLGLGMRDFGKDDARAADRARRKILKMPVVGHPVVRRILAHRRHHDAIGRLHGPQGEWTEQVRRWIANKNAPCVFSRHLAPRSNLPRG